MKYGLKEQVLLFTLEDFVDDNPKELAKQVRGFTVKLICVPKEMESTWRNTGLYKEISPLFMVGNTEYAATMYYRSLDQVMGFFAIKDSDDETPLFNVDIRTESSLPNASGKENPVFPDLVWADTERMDMKGNMWYERSMVTYARIQDDYGVWYLQQVRETCSRTYPIEYQLYMLAKAVYTAVYCAKIDEGFTSFDGRPMFKKDPNQSSEEDRLQNKIKEGTL